jgi:hypothetical protein
LSRALVLENATFRLKEGPAAQKGRAEGYRDRAEASSHRAGVSCKGSGPRLQVAMSVDVSLAQAVRAQLPVLRAELFLLRRKGIRNLYMDWSPLAKGFVPLPCEACFAIPGAFSVCDDNLHLVCSACMPACSACARESCRVCHPVQGPRCGHAWEKHQAILDLTILRLREEINFLINRILQPIRKIQGTGWAAHHDQPCPAEA